MENFYLLNRLITEDNLYIWEYEAPEAYEDYSSGQSITENSQPIKLFQKNKTKKKTDYLAGIFSFPIISSNFRKLLTESRITCIEFHPVELICKRNGTVDNSYSFLNILDNIACFDWQKSEFETGFIRYDVVREVRKLTIRKDKIKGRDLFRIEEIPSVIVVSLRLRKIIEAAEISGIQFKEIDAFQMP